MAEQVRWGIFGTANIAVRSFLPAVREAGGLAAAVASRDPGRAGAWAAGQGVERVVDGYQRLVADPDIDAVYVPLPNGLHAEWTIAALRAGKPVLCEKPLTATVADTERVLAVARETGTPLWEAFVFPFHDQMRRIRALLADGVIGDLREIQSDFHFPLTDTAHDIRMDPALGGGALFDVGCYPVWLARHLFRAEHHTAVAGAIMDPGGVDVATWGYLGFPGGRRLMLSCGFRRAKETFSRLLGTAGQIHVTSAFHPTAADWFEVHRPGHEPVREPGAGPNQHSFTPAVEHIQAVVQGREEPRELATGTSAGSARALADLAASARAGGSAGG